MMWTDSSRKGLEFMLGVFGLQDTGDMTALVRLSHDGPVAGALYRRTEIDSISMSVWIRSSPGPEFGRAMFALPFDVMGVREVINSVRKDNSKSIKLTENAGFKRVHETDTHIVYRLTKDTCKVLKWRRSV